MNQCSRCSADLTTFPPQVSAGGGQICSSCGAVLSEGTTTSGGFERATATKGLESATDWLKDFFSKIKQITLHPKRFFSENGAIISKDEGLTSALAFAVLVQWIAAFFNFLWRAMTGSFVQERFGDFFKSTQGIDEIRQKATEFFLGAGSVLLTPFTTLLQLLFSGFLIHIAVRFFIREPADRPLRYSTTLKILALSNAAWILCFIPGLGLFFAWVISLNAAYIGIREVYKTSGLRAGVAVLFPEILFLTFVFILIFCFLFLALGTLRLLF